MNRPPRLFRAQAAWTGDRWIRRPVLVERHGAIEVIGTEQEVAIPTGAEGIDFGDAVALPGFINAHCHLEYSCLKGRLSAGAPFADWLEKLVQGRFGLEESEFRRGAEAGLAEAIESGTTAILDIFTRGAAEQPLRASGLRAWAFLEAICLNPEDAEPACADLVRRLTRLDETNRFRAGLSPHAPYSVSLPLARRIAGLAQDRRLPLAVHLAETEEEIEFLASGGGALASLFRRMGVMPEQWAPPGISPVEWGDRAGLLSPRTFLIHGNYLSDADIRRLAQRGASVVYCPRSHAFFGHAPHPLPKLLAAGVNVCIGTDSLASNDRLDLLAELREARGGFSAVSAAQWFAMIGRNAARALQLDGKLGALRAGCECDLTVLAPAPDVEGEPALERLLAPDAARAIATIVGGDCVWRR
ncbi:MAG: amidohydrolase family protein [Candidatus Sumerlaeota bacterium]|nr:amidohydrolase family protein [Candidatus Sumerlaeota bacterium]